MGPDYVDICKSLSSRLSICQGCDMSAVAGDGTIAHNIVVDVEPGKPMWRECGSGYKNDLGA